MAKQQNNGTGSASSEKTSGNTQERTANRNVNGNVTGSGETSRPANRDDIGNKRGIATPSASRESRGDTSEQQADDQNLDK